MHGFSHRFPVARENAAKPILWGEPGKLVKISRNKLVEISKYIVDVYMIRKMLVYNYYHMSIAGVFWPENLLVWITKIELWESPRPLPNFVLVGVKLKALESLAGMSSNLLNQLQFRVKFFIFKSNSIADLGGFM